MYWLPQVSMFLPCKPPLGTPHRKVHIYLNHNNNENTNPTRFLSPLNISRASSLYLQQPPWGSPVLLPIQSILAPSSFPDSSTMRLQSLWRCALLASTVSATALTYKMTPNEKACFFTDVAQKGAKIAFYFAVSFVAFFFVCRCDGEGCLRGVLREQRDWRDV
jgi:hypothetical protein